MQPTLNPALREFWAAKDVRNRVLYGGRSSSKSWDASGVAVWMAARCKMRFLCARQFQNKIEESVYTLLKAQINRFGLQAHYRVLDNKIICTTTGSEFLFYGLWRSIDEIKSMEGIDVCWIEEAHNLTQEQWEILDPTLRREGSQFWIIFNPRLSTDFVYRYFVRNPPPRTIIRKINYTENPFLPADMLERIEHLKATEPDKWAHIYGGDPLEDDDAAIIKRSWLNSAIDAHKQLGIEPTGALRIGFDIADSGEDKCAQVMARGSLAFWLEEWSAREDELLKSCTRVWTKARECGAFITYDSIGVGASAGAKFNELNAGVPVVHERVRHAKFNAGGAVFRPETFYSPKVKNKDMFVNLKAQAWWLVADRLKNTYLAIKEGKDFKQDEMLFVDGSIPNLDRLIDELVTPQRDFDNTGKVKVESKKDLAKRDIPSPNMADAFVMAYAPGQLPMVINPELIKQA